MINTMEIYEKLQTPPNDALKPIGFGNLKGKSDINPQWRYEALTNVLGPCGIGWKFEVADRFTEPVPTGELMVFVQVNLYIMDKESGHWSEPIPGWGGDYLIKKDKNGIHGNDEAVKMATTDALGTAAKMLGVAADVYRGLVANGVSDSKYARRDYAAQSAQNGAGQARNAKASNYTNGANKTAQNGDLMAKAKHSLKTEVERIGCTWEEVKAIAGLKIGKTETKDMTVGEVSKLAANLEQWILEQSA